MIDGAGSKHGRLNGYPMSDNRKRTVEPPSYLRERLPSPVQLKECLTSEPFAVGGEAQLYRAAIYPRVSCR